MSPRGHAAAPPAPQPPVVLVVAKAPVAGEAKTRLAASIGDAASAELAAAALLDTLDAASLAAAWLGGGRAVVALTGDPTRGARPGQVDAALARCIVIPQRGTGLSQRLAAAHADAATLGGRGAARPVVQVGMDTPQVDAELLVRCARLLQDGDAVLGAAHDGGWWLLGVRRPASARALLDVPMSTPHTGAATLAALQALGASVVSAPELRDVDVLADAEAVALAAPRSRFAAALSELDLTPGHAGRRARAAS